MRWVTVSLLVLLLAVQGGLWLGKNNLPHVMGLHKQLDTQLALNLEARQRNSRVVAEVKDLKEGEEIIEEKARLELGMVKPGEVLVQIAPTRR
jgi:cell division protein FtsB